jgi:SAM-dependent methyltransferase
MADSEKDVTGSARHDEVRAVIERYARRDDAVGPYSILRPEVLLSIQERERAMLGLLVSAAAYTDADLRRLHLVDVGCGYGGHLLTFVRCGFAPENLSGIELLPDRFAAARARLPAAVTMYQGDANSTSLPAESQDVVYQSTVFSSLLSDDYQLSLAEQMWSWLRPGGGVLWYDFVYDNPRNPDVRGVPLRRVRQLFPRAAALTVRRITLAPPISRRVCKLHSAAYHFFNAIPPLRTHALCWIAKGRA